MPFAHVWIVRQSFSGPSAQVFVVMGVCPHAAGGPATHAAALPRNSSNAPNKRILPFARRIRISLLRGNGAEGARGARIPTHRGNASHASHARHADVAGKNARDRRG